MKSLQHGRQVVMREKLCATGSLFFLHERIEENAKHSLWQTENLFVGSSSPFSGDLGLSVAGEI